MTQLQEARDSTFEKRKTSYLRAAVAAHMRGYWLSGGGQSILLEGGKDFLKEILPEPITRGELETLLAPVQLESEFHFLEYVMKLEDLLCQDPKDLSLYQHLMGRLEKLGKALDDYDLTLRHFHVLLGLRILNTGVEQGLLSWGKEPDGFRWL